MDPRSVNLCLKGQLYYTFYKVMNSSKYTYSNKLLKKSKKDGVAPTSFYKESIILMSDYYLS